MPKPQQNSYPFYAPKVQPIKVDNNFPELGMGHKNSKSPARINQNASGYQPFQSKVGTGYSSNPGNKGFNSTFSSNTPNPHYRNS